MIKNHRTTNVRLIARLDIKGENLIKGVHLEGLKIVGNPNAYAIKYYQEGIDEIIYMDSVASLYGRNNLTDIVKSTTKDVYIPITVGGGIRHVDDVEKLLRSGADKVAIGTAAVKNPQLISEISKKFGSQCMVLSIEAKAIDGKWNVFIENGRTNTQLDVIEWAKKAEELHAGEILLTSIDKEGTNKGFDLELINQVSQNVNIPVIASGGAGTCEHIIDAVKNGNADAVAVADILHFNKLTINTIKEHSNKNMVNMRNE